MTLSPTKQQHAARTLADPRWTDVVARNANADGRFFYSVRTTGVYCRPSCAARLAHPENVDFHPSCDDAEAAGFRPCKRCRPDAPSRRERHHAIVVQASRIIEQAETAPDLASLAARVGLSAYHFHRIFKQATGLTPHQYALARRQQQVRAALAKDTSVTHAIFDAGYGSSSRFYAAADATLGMTPTAWRAGGERTRIRFAVGQCTLGAILVAQSERGVCAILLGDEPEPLLRDLQDRFPKAALIAGDAAFETIVGTVVGFVDAPATGLELPLDIRGTVFQQRVWRALRDIPVGRTVSYTEVARMIGAPTAVRAVATACAANAIAVAIPCHRVVRNDGGLSGYRWGIERKRTLIDAEAGTTADNAAAA